MNVFAILAKKAKQAAAHDSPEAWIFTTTRLESAMAMRKQQQRQRKLEILAGELGAAEWVDCDEAEAWHEALPHLYQSLDSLAKHDREILLARFFVGNTFAEIAERFGKSEAACKMQVKRSLEKLKTWMSRRGIRLSVTTLAAGLSSEWVKAAPAQLLSALPARAIATARGIGSKTLFSHTLQTMSRTTKTTLIASSLAVLVGIGMVQSRSNDLSSSEAESVVAEAPATNLAPEPRVLSGLPGKLAEPKVEDDLQERFEQIVAAQVPYAIWVKQGQAEPGDYHRYLRDTFLENAGGDLERATSKAIEMLRFYEMRDQRLAERRDREPVVTPARASEYLREIDATAIDYAVMAVLSKSPAFYADAADRFPTDPSARLASLLEQDRYRHDPEGIAALAASCKDDAWPALLAARRALLGGDFTAAARALSKTAGKPLSRPYDEFANAAARYLASEFDLGQDEASSHESMERLEFLRAGDFAMNFLREITGELQEQGHPKKDLLTLASAANGLAQTWRNGANTVEERWDGAIEQRDLLRKLGPDLGDQALEGRYQATLDLAIEEAARYRAEIRARGVN